MKPHKWHKEIKAWADGAEIEARFKEASSFKDEGTWADWEEMDSTCRFSEDNWWEYRIKPQPKEPQYLYVLMNTAGRIEFHEKMYPPTVYIGKIKLETDDYGD